MFPDKFGTLKKMIKDPAGGLVWIYTEKAVFRFVLQFYYFVFLVNLADAPTQERLTYNQCIQLGSVP